MLLQLIDGYSGNGKSNFNLWIFPDELQQQGICWQIAIRGDSLDNLPVLRIIEI
jgi:hypothetical protein